MCYCLDCGRRISCITLETDGLCFDCRFASATEAGVARMALVELISLDELREKMAAQEEKEEEENDD